MSELSLLPPRNATAFMRALEGAIAYEPRVSPGVELITDIKGRQLPAFVQFLLYEYGLIELTPYVENPYTLLIEGRPWQLERDTLAAVLRGLGWVNAPATIEEAATRRFWWNSFQLRFASLPPNDHPALDRIDRITQLGKPFRSDFRRGVWGYDAPAVETDATRLDSCLLDQESGVRLRDGGPLWSFGRAHEYVRTLTEDEGEALGNYLVPTGERSILIDFLTGEYLIGETPVSQGDVMSFARASGQWAENEAGELTSFAVDEPAITDLGLWLEAAATNEIANNTDGDAWSLPPNKDGLTIEVVGEGSVGGIDYADIRVYGATSDRTGMFVAFNAASISPASGQVWTVSAWAAIVAGSAAGLEDFSAFGVDMSGLGSTLERIAISGATPAINPILPGVQFGYDVGATIDVTIRLGLPQLERGLDPSSPIKTTGAAAVRAASELVIHLPPGLHNVEFTFSDGSTQTFDGRVGDFAVNPATLNRRVIEKIEAIQLDGFESLRWTDLTFPWSDAEFPWVSPAGNARRIFLAKWFDDRPGLLVLKRQDDTIIGYRRLRSSRQVKPQIGGPIVANGVAYTPDESGEFVVIDAMTDAGNGAGQQAAKVAVSFNWTLAPGVKPGRLWLTPGQVIGGVEIAPYEVSIDLRATVRERVKLLLRF